MREDARLTTAERRLELVIGLGLIAITARLAAVILIASTLGFAICWFGLVLSVHRRERHHFGFGRRLLVVLTITGLVWLMFGLALASDERHDDATTLPTVIAIGRSDATIDSQSAILYGVISVLGIAASLDGFRHGVRRRHGHSGTRRKSKIAAGLSVKSPPTQ
jgi:hypothetical protein